MRPPNFDPNPYWLAPYDWLTSFQGWDPLGGWLFFTTNNAVIGHHISYRSRQVWVYPYHPISMIIIHRKCDDFYHPWLKYPQFGHTMGKFTGWWLPRWWNSQCFFTNAPSFFGTNTSGQDLKISHFFGSPRDWIWDFCGMYIHLETPGPPRSTRGS